VAPTSRMAALHMRGIHRTLEFTLSFFLSVYYMLASTTEKVMRTGVYIYLLIYLWATQNVVNGWEWIFFRSIHFRYGSRNNAQFLPARRSMRRLCYGNVAGWLAVSHSRYCIKTIKPILKLFRPSGSPVIEAFETPYADTKFQGEPLHRGR